MQLYFLSFFSSSLFFLEVVVNVFDYFWKPNSLFSSFVLTVFWCSTSYTVLIVLWKMLMQPVNAPARWLPCARLKCISSPRILEKTLNFLICIHVFDLVLKYGSDINEGNWLQLPFYFIVLMGIVTAVIGIRFFSAVFHVLDWSFLLLYFDGNVCNWIPKVNLTTNGLILGFFVGKWLLSLTSYLYGLKSAGIAQLLFFLTTWNFFDV